MVTVNGKELMGGGSAKGAEAGKRRGPGRVGKEEGSGKREERLAS